MAKRLQDGNIENMIKVRKKYGVKESNSTEEDLRSHLDRERENKELQSHLREVGLSHHLYIRIRIIFSNKLAELGARLQGEQRTEILKFGNKLVPFKNWSPALAEVMKSAKWIEPYCYSPDMAFQVVFELMPGLYS